MNPTKAKRPRTRVRAKKLLNELRALGTTPRTRTVRSVPTPSDFDTGAEVVAVEGTVLFADLGGSTKLVDRYDWRFAAWVYKAYLKCATAAIVGAGGTVTAFEGDGVMAVFVGPTKDADAVLCAFQLQWSMTHVLNPLLKARYQGAGYTACQVVGLDAGTLRAVRTGVWDAYDLLWIGRAANYAANLTTVYEPGYSTFATESVFAALPEELKTAGGTPLWEPRAPLNAVPVYRSAVELPL